MEDNPSTSQGMHKRQARQWKTYCCVPQCNDRDLKIVVYGKRLTSDTLFAIKTKSLTVKMYYI